MKTNLSCASFSRLGLATACLAVLLAGCGGGSSSPSSVVITPQTKTVAATATTLTALVAITPLTATFNSGFSGVTGSSSTSVSLSGSTTLQVSAPSSGSNPSFTLSRGGNTAQGYMTFGSCKFYPNGWPNESIADHDAFAAAFALNNPNVTPRVAFTDPPFKVDTCSIGLTSAQNTVVQSGNSATVSMSTTLTLNSVTSVATDRSFTVTSTGALTPAGASQSIVDFTVAPYTGTGTGSSNP